MFTADQLRTFIGHSQDVFDMERARLVVSVTSGHFLGALGLTVWPVSWTPVFPAQVTSWGLEYGGILYENPTSISHEAQGEVTTSWQKRRDEILEQFRAWAVVSGVITDPQRSARMPAGSFPAAPCWPEPDRLAASYMRSPLADRDASWRL